MRIAITGGGGLVGRFLVHEALARGDTPVILSRRAPDPRAFPRPVAHLPYELGGPVPDLDGFDALVHAAFAHLPGRYRGGEGDDPQGFATRNAGGTAALFEAAAGCVGRAVFLSSRAVHDAAAAGSLLREDDAVAPTCLYGQVKLAGEAALADSFGARGVSLRVTGVYGQAVPGQPHKWAGLFADFLAGRPIAPRAGTEVHGADVATAVRLALSVPVGAAPGVLNVSDLLLDRHDLLAEVARLTGCTSPLPARDRRPIGILSCDRITGLGWRPGGWDRLRACLPDMLATGG